MLKKSRLDFWVNFLCVVNTHTHTQSYCYIASKYKNVI